MGDSILKGRKQKAIPKEYKIQIDPFSGSLNNEKLKILGKNSDQKIEHFVLQDATNTNLKHDRRILHAMVMGEWLHTTR